MALFASGVGRFRCALLVLYALSSISAINDVNNWIGRSQYMGDDYFGGKISEFRIYSAALTGPQLKTSKKMGENTTYLQKP